MREIQVGKFVVEARRIAGEYGRLGEQVEKEVHLMASGAEIYEKQCNQLLKKIEQWEEEDEPTIDTEIKRLMEQQSAEREFEEAHSNELIAAGKGTLKGII